LLIDSKSYQHIRGKADDECDKPSDDHSHTGILVLVLEEDHISDGWFFDVVFFVVDVEVLAHTST
jgi:hypothetical protein